MSAPRQLDEAAAPPRRLHDRSGWGIVGQPHVPHRVSESQQVIDSWFRLFLDCEPDHFPTARRRKSLRVLLAQVITMWFRLGGQRTEDRRGVSVGICQSRGRRTRAACSGTPARPHLPDATPRAGSIVGSAAVSGKCPAPGIRCLCASFRWMPRKADEGGIPGRMSTEENAARRRMDGAHLWRIPGAGH